MAQSWDMGVFQANCSGTARQFTPTALASTDNNRRYDFSDVRFATLTLLTLTALLRRNS